MKELRSDLADAQGVMTKQNQRMADLIREKREEHDACEQYRRAFVAIIQHPARDAHNIAMQALDRTYGALFPEEKG
jgi:hypothetical protein